MERIIAAISVWSPKVVISAQLLLLVVLILAVPFGIVRIGRGSPGNGVNVRRGLVITSILTLCVLGLASIGVGIIMLQHQGMGGKGDSVTVALFGLAFFGVAAAQKPYLRVE